MRNLILLLAVAALAVLLACNGGGGSSNRTLGSGSATVTTTLSDPATCSSSANGPYNNIWVTVTDVQIHTSTNAPDNDPNWIDLTPSLKNSPQQVDLLAQATNQCFLATLGSNTALQAGTYQQIRIILGDNSTSVQNNHCGSVGSNCVILAANAGVPQPLLLSSESRTGIKIPSGQIAGGNFTIAAGQSKDLNIDFDTCASIVVLGTGQFRLKPSLHAGEVALTSVSITGKLVDSATNAAIAGGKAIVALEQRDANGVDRVIMQATPDATGAFNFCPVPAGTYDVVAVAVSGSNVAYAATITTGVQPGNALGNVPLFAVTGASTAPGTVTGQVTAVNASNAATPTDVLLSALQTVGAISFTIPAGSQSVTLSLATPANYTLTLPPANPTTGTFSTSGTTYTQNAGNASYIVEGQAFVPMSGGLSDCAQPKLTTAAVTPTAGGTIAATALAFTGCQ